MRWGGGTLGACGPACFPSWSGSALPPVPRASGWPRSRPCGPRSPTIPFGCSPQPTSRSCCRSRGPTSTRSRHWPPRTRCRVAPPATDEGQQVDSREAMAVEQADRSDVPTNADDRPSRLGSDPGTLGSTGGGPARVTAATPAVGAVWSPTRSSRGTTPDAVAVTLTDAHGHALADPVAADALAVRHPEPGSVREPLARAEPLAQHVDVARGRRRPRRWPTPSPTPSAPVTPTAGPPKPRPTATASPTAPPPMYTLVPLSGFVAVWERLVPLS